MQSSEAEAEQGHEPPVEVVWTEEVPYLAEVRAVLELGHQERQATVVHGVHMRLAGEPRA